ncbi:MAG: hypothetical protein QM770_18965 [Tepidisphaeraceae bacterium]
MPRQLLTEHHLVPRERGGLPEHKVPMCKACHGHVHATYDNRTLAIAFNTLHAMRRDPAIQKFVRFIRKQDATSSFRSASRRDKRR